MAHLTKDESLNFDPQIVSRGPKYIVFYSTYGKERSGLRIAALARLEGTLSAKSPFGNFRVTDLTSKVKGWPKTFNLGINGFGSWQASRWFSNRGSSSLRKEFIGEIAFWPLSGHWSDLRGQRLTQDLKFGYQRFRLLTRNTLVF